MALSVGIILAHDSVAVAVQLMLYNGC